MGIDCISILERLKSVGHCKAVDNAFKFGIRKRGYDLFTVSCGNLDNNIIVKN